MKTFLIAGLAALALALAPSAVMAGGGSKNTSTITVNNNTDFVTAVALGNSTGSNLAGLQTAINTGTATQANLVTAANASGLQYVIIQPHSTASFTNVKSGTYTVAAVALSTGVPATIATASTAGTRTITVANGQHVTLNLSGPTIGAGSGTAITIQ
jgi:hypothetical protein